MRGRLMIFDKRFEAMDKRFEAIDRKSSIYPAFLVLQKPSRLSFRINILKGVFYGVLAAGEWV